jgi:hypothetical protein
MWRRHTTTQPAEETLAELAYDHAVRGLDSQISVLTESRTRAHNMVIASVGVATLFGGFLLRAPSVGSGIDIAASIPLAFLLAGVAYAIGVLEPTGKQGQQGALELVASASAIVKLPVDDATSARRDIAVALESMWDANQQQVERLMDRLRNAARCLAAQVACWTILLIIKQVV